MIAEHPPWNNTINVSSALNERLLFGWKLSVALSQCADCKLMSSMLVCWGDERINSLTCWGRDSNGNVSLQLCTAHSGSHTDLGRRNDCWRTAGELLKPKQKKWIKLNVWLHGSIGGNRRREGLYVLNRIVEKYTDKSGSKKPSNSLGCDKCFIHLIFINCSCQGSHTKAKLQM